MKKQKNHGEKKELINKINEYLVSFEGKIRVYSTDALEAKEKVRRLLSKRGVICFEITKQTEKQFGGKK